MPAVARPRASDARQYTSWDRARLSVVVPIGVIVAVAIVCIVVAVLSSAQRADVVAVDHEKQLFSRALTNYGERVLREVESVASSEGAIQNIRQSFDPNGSNSASARGWRHTSITTTSSSSIARTRLLYSLVGHRPPTRNGLRPARRHSLRCIDYMRGRDPSLHGAIRLNQVNPTEGGAHRQTAVIRSLHGPARRDRWRCRRPERSIPPSIDGAAPIVMSVKFIDDGALSRIAAQLRLTNLRKIEQSQCRVGDLAYRSRRARMARSSPVSPGRRSNRAPKSCTTWCRSSRSPSPVSRCSPLSCCATCAAPRRRLRPAKSRLRHLAMHDPLCGLPNRIFFGERLEAVIEEVRGGSAPAAVFYIDLDHFKDVNDTLGHHVGDELIRNVTLRLSHTLRGGDLVARLGGDEFAVISSIAGDSEMMMGLAQRIIAAICAPYSISGQNIIIGASIGIAVIDKNCGTATDIMRYADMALYRAKNEGRNRACIYDAAMDADLSTRKLLEADLREAIENDRLQLLYQPIVNKSGESVIGVEALCRWTHPVRGEISPSEFIAIAEHSGLIIDLGNWVLRRACIDGHAWPELTVAVNVSSLQFRRIDFVDVVERILNETHFDPARLELELTESVLLGNVDTAEDAMLRLKALGVRLALDDFGTGYSSLLYLRRFPFDKLKIDRSFVLSIEKAADAAAIVHAIVSLGRGLGMKVTAEGVETADQQLFLRAAGVHSMQGFRFGRPVTVARSPPVCNRPMSFSPPKSPPPSQAERPFPP